MVFLRHLSYLLGLQSLLFLHSTTAAVSSPPPASNTNNNTSTSSSFYSECHKDPIPLDEKHHKRKYRVAVHAVRGLEEDLALYNQTFETYLSATAGRRFDPPIEFELVPVTYTDLFTAVEETDEHHIQVDFMFANPGSYSCIGVEYGVVPLVTKISHLEVRGHPYDLDVFGGVLFSRADREDIHSILDLKDKVIGASSINSLMGGQTQMYEMVLAGMDYVMDPKQMVFTDNKVHVVEGVLSGEFDVGMVRTDQIERATDAEGNLLDPNLFRVLEPRVHVLDDGTLFPFLHSTDTYGEWPVAAMTHVADDVVVEVQAALLALGEHSAPFKSMLSCLEETGGQSSDMTCDEVFWNQVTRCDTTAEVAEIAYSAGKIGKHVGFRSPHSYFDVRTMQEVAGFMTEDHETGTWACVHSDNLYDSVTCPPEHYKLPLEDFVNSCEEAGLPCKEDYDCYCRPCVRAFEVAVFQYDPNDNTTLDHRGCDKMDLCGTMEQREEVYFMVVDNKQRKDPHVTALIHLGHYTHDIVVEKLSDYTYQIHWNENLVGEGIVEVSFDGENIPESPFRIHILPRTCNTGEEGSGAGNRVPDENGDCICANGTTEIGGSCVTDTILAVIGSIIGLFAAGIAAYFFIRHKNYLNDMVWHVNPDELHFDDPMEVIGEGAFGVVLLAEYRGTKVAIKRAVKTGGSSGSRASQQWERKANTGSIEFGIDKPLPRESHVSAVSSHVSWAGSDISQDELEAAQTAGELLNSAHFENSKSRSKSIKPGGRRGSVSVYKSKRSENMLDIGFLADKFGKGRRRTGWFGGGKSGTNERFEAAISRGSSKTGSSSLSRTIAAKLCPGMSAERRRREEFIAEMRLLSTLRHPCICTIMGAVMATAHGPMIVMEYMEYGSLHDMLANETMYLTGEIILQIGRDVAQGLRYLHSAKPAILHGDLKPANILVDSRFRAKVCDFGLSRKKKNTISGSLFWLAPEYLIGNEDYSPACDMYSMGIVLNEMYSRKKPYQGEDVDLRQLLSDICDRRTNKRPFVSPTCPPKMVDLVKKLWSRDPTVRPQARQLDMMLVEYNIQDVEPLTPEAMNAKPRTQDMLYELFPRHIAEALKAGRKVEPESHEMVSIVFSDIKGFTDISREISPMKVSMMLDRLYLAFDKIAGKHGVFKVETIGDAYMGVTNLVHDQEEDHVKRIAEFAVDMINEASQILIDEDEPERGYISIRVGFHSGPVVSNVIGSLNPRYGLFGDTVNTASRMESNSAGGRILCSESSFLLLKRQAPDMPVRKRGKIPVKGKGDMTVFWIGDELIAHNQKKRRKTMKPNDAKSMRDISSMFNTSVAGLSMDESARTEQAVPMIQSPAASVKLVEPTSADIEQALPMIQSPAASVKLVEPANADIEQALPVVNREEQPRGARGSKIGMDPSLKDLIMDASAAAMETSWPALEKSGGEDVGKPLKLGEEGNKSERRQKSVVIAPSVDSSLKKLLMEPSASMLEHQAEEGETSKSPGCSHTTHETSGETSEETDIFEDEPPSTVIGDIDETRKILRPGHSSPASSITVDV